VDSSAESVLSAKSVLSTESVLGSEIHDSYTCNMVGAFFISSLLATLVRSLWNLELRMRYRHTGWIGTVEVNRDTGLEPGET